MWIETLLLAGAAHRALDCVAVQGKLAASLQHSGFKNWTAPILHSEIHF